MFLTIEDEKGFMDYKIIARSKENITAQEESININLIETIMKTQLNVLAFRWPPELKCRTGPDLWTHSGGEGIVKAAAVIGKGTNNGVTIILSHPDVPGNNTYKAICKESTITRDIPSSIFNSLNPWIKESFPPDGGSKKIKISEYDESVEKVSKMKGIVSVHYEAEMMVTRFK